jgi:hypothetical protein
MAIKAGFNFIFGMLYSIILINFRKARSYRTSRQVVIYSNLVQNLAYIITIIQKIYYFLQYINSIIQAKMEPMGRLDHGE